MHRDDAPLDAQARTAAEQRRGLGWRKAGAPMITTIEGGCTVCGRAQLNGSPTDAITSYPNGAIRCGDHHGRNPCAIEGCKRTRAAPMASNGFHHHADDKTLCADHWRRFVPPRSRMRRAYHAHFRRAKRQGWTDRNREAFWRFWDQLVRLARLRATEGHIDKAEIDRLMGW